MTSVPVSVTDNDGVQVITNTRSADQMRETLGVDQPEEKVSKAASELGKHAAESRKLKPIPPKPKVEAKPEPKPEVTEEPKEAAPVEVSEADEPKAEEPKKDRRGDPRHDPIARMKEATRKEAEAKREAAQYRAMIAQLQSQLEAKPQTAEQEQARGWDGSSKPKVEDFEDYEDFVDARARWTYQQLDNERQAQMAQHEQIRTIATKAQTFAEQFDAAQDDPEVGAKLHPQFLEKFLSLEIASTVPPGERKWFNYVAEEVFNSPVAPKVLLYLQEHPDVRQRLATLETPASIMREMAKIEARFDGATKTGPPAKRESSKAEPPVEPVTGSPNTSMAPEDIKDLDKHIEYYNALEKKRLSKR